MREIFSNCCSEEFHLTKGLCLIKPDETSDTLELQNGIIYEVDREKSIIYRPCSGTLIKGSDSISNNGCYRVFFPSTNGLDVKFSDGDFIILQEKDIVGFQKIKND